MTGVHLVALRGAEPRILQGLGDASGDIFASSDYRAHLTRVYTRRALAAAVERARKGA